MLSPYSKKIAHFVFGLTFILLPFAVPSYRPEHGEKHKIFQAIYIEEPLNHIVIRNSFAVF